MISSSATGGESPHPPFRHLARDHRGRPTSGVPLSDTQTPGLRVGNAGRSPSFEFTTTVARYDWEHCELAPNGASAGLSLSATLHSGVRGSVHWPGTSYTLRLDGWELVGPPELGADWAATTRHALDQLRRRVDGKPHITPEAGGRWDVSVRKRLRVVGAPVVPSRLAADSMFSPREMFVEASTNGAGSLLLFGPGPVEMASTRYTFTVGLGGLVAFDQLDPGEQVPDWAQAPAIEATRSAFDLHAAAARLLVDEATGARA